MKITPYITLNGNCKEAVAFYEKALNAKVIMSQTYSEAPSGDYPMPEAAKDLIVHARIDLGGEQIMFSDSFPGQPVPNESFITLALSVNSLEQTTSIYNALKEGGTILMELGETFWSKSYAMLIDRFGVQWQLNYDETK